MSLVSKILKLSQHFNSVRSLVRSSGSPADSTRIDQSISASRPFLSHGMPKLGVARTHFRPFEILQNFEHIYRVTRTLKVES